MSPEKRQDLLSKGYREFRVSCPSRPAIAERVVIAGDELTAGNKYRRETGCGATAALKIEPVAQAPAT